MDRQELADVWSRNKDRPQFLRAHHDAFSEHLSETTAGNLPSPDASTYAYREFLEAHKSAITKQLTASDDADAEDDPEVVV